jgi:hypothetical protein
VLIELLHELVGYIFGAFIAACGAMTAYFQWKKVRDGRE